MRISFLISAGTLAMLASASPLRVSITLIRFRLPRFLTPMSQRKDLSVEERAKAADYIYPIPASVAPEERSEAADYIYPIPASVAPEKRAEAADYIYPIPASVAPEERAEAADYIYPIPASVVPEEE